MVVVTGATGHIGNALVRELVAGGVKVRALVLPSDPVKSIEGLGIELAYGDVRDYRSLVRAFKGADVVYHLAGIVAIGSGKKRLLREVNVQGTKNVSDACLDLGVPRLVYVSSIHAFKEPPMGTPILETKDFDARKVSGGYAKSKAEATKYVLGLTVKGLDAVVVHPTGVIGPYEYGLSHMGQLFVDFMRSRLFAVIDGAYDFVDVRDVAKGIVLAAKYGRKGENYILSGEHVTIKNMMQVLQDETGIKAPKRVIPTWFAYITGAFAELYYMAMRQKPLFTSYSVATLSSNSLTSCNKANKELGYSPRPFRDTVRDTVAWLRKTIIGAK